MNDQNWAKNIKIQTKLTRKYSKRVYVTAKFLLMTKSAGLRLKILLLVLKPTGHLVPRCRNNFQLWKPFQAHIYVFSAFSPVLKNILLNIPHPHPLIYIRGVNQQELDSILQFIRKHQHLL